MRVDLGDGQAATLPAQAEAPPARDGDSWRGRRCPILLLLLPPFPLQGQSRCRCARDRTCLALSSVERAGCAGQFDQIRNKAAAKLAALACVPGVAEDEVKPPSKTKLSADSEPPRKKKKAKPDATDAQAAPKMKSALKTKSKPSGSGDDPGKEPAGFHRLAARAAAGGDSAEVARELFQLLIAPTTVAPSPPSPPTVPSRNSPSLRAPTEPTTRQTPPAPARRRALSAGRRAARAARRVLRRVP